MKASIIPIVNSQGIRFPKAVLIQCGLAGEVELEVVGKQLIIRSARCPRQDWDQAFQRMARNGDDQLINLDMSSKASKSWDEGEWEWK